MTRIAKSYRLLQSLVGRIERLVGFRARVHYPERPLRETDVVHDALTMGMTSLEQRTCGWGWRCDKCSKPIENVEAGWIEWWSAGIGPDQECKGLRLVHNNGSGRCQYEDRPQGRFHLQDLPLASFVGVSGFAQVADLADAKWDDARSVWRLLLRLNQPGYEQVFRHARACDIENDLDIDARRIEFIADWMLSEGDGELAADAARALELIGADERDGDGE